jgi:hypothetical protein
LYTLSATRIAKLLLLIASKLARLAEFHIAKYFNLLMKLRGRLVPSHKRMQSEYSKGAEDEKFRQNFSEA